jgi:hypothetical protein
MFFFTPPWEELLEQEPITIGVREPASEMKAAGATPRPFVELLRGIELSVDLHRVVAEIFCRTADKNGLFPLMVDDESRVSIIRKVAGSTSQGTAFRLMISAPGQPNAGIVQGDIRDELRGTHDEALRVLRARCGDETVGDFAFVPYRVGGYSANSSFFLTIWEALRLWIQGELGVCYASAVAQGVPIWNAAAVLHLEEIREADADVLSIVIGWLQSSFARKRGKARGQVVPVLKRALSMSRCEALDESWRLELGRAASAALSAIDGGVADGACEGLVEAVRKLLDPTETALVIPAQLSKLSSFIPIEHVKTSRELTEALLAGYGGGLTRNVIASVLPLLLCGEGEVLQRASWLTNEYVCRHGAIPVTISIRHDFASNEDVLILDADTSPFQNRWTQEWGGVKLESDKETHVVLIGGVWRIAKLLIYLLLGSWANRTFQFVSKELLMSLDAKVERVDGDCFDFRADRPHVTAAASQTVALGPSAAQWSDYPGR